ncbi:MFS general substrate transporter [Epithele typhae]|uniref:MFS general substrate transporter n=1 Tax=Epithele typhae TaxID=378194 RepID=UPI002007704B|nr:MFS general substrate transporter [Epithele typhae]KAH9922288.1 MFS general substrate transporter [Epithele typhae]
MSEAPPDKAARTYHLSTLCSPPSLTRDPYRLQASFKARSKCAPVSTSAGAGCLAHARAVALPAETDVLEPAKESTVEAQPVDGPQEYRLYKRRWIGLVALVLLNIVSGLLLVWFGPIANDVVDEFGFTLDEVNWLGNVINLIYLPCAFVLPYLYGRLGIRGTAYIGAVLFVLSAWVRYAGTAKSLSVRSSYALILIGQLIAGFTLPIFQIIVPSYSERWFDLKGRTTATMVMSLANPVGNALGQLIPPLVGSPRTGLLVMAIIFTVAAPIVFFVGERPPIPPTFAGSHTYAPTITDLGNAMLGKTPSDRHLYMTPRQRLDFGAIVILFGVLVGVVNAFGILTGQQLEPYGYSSDDAGIMGAVLLLAGLLGAAITSPLFDRVLTHHLALSAKVCLPIMAACWLSLIWEIKPNNTTSLYIILVILGATSLTLLPVVLELAVELTRNAEGSSAVLWFSANLCSLAFVLIEGALRAGTDASPPQNMHRAIVFQGAVVASALALVYLVEGKQTRRAADEQARDGAAAERVAVTVAVVDAGADVESGEVSPGTSDATDVKVKAQ